MKRTAYVITRTDDDRPEDERVLSRGTQNLEDDADARAFAEGRLRENRAQHSYYTGPRTIAIWPHDGVTPLPDTAPTDAERIDG